MALILYTIPRSLEGIFDLLFKLGFPLNFDYIRNFIFAFAIASLLLMRKKYKEDFPCSYLNILNNIYKE